jgi:hypothetical protein
MGATGFIRNSLISPLIKMNDRRSIGRTKIAKGNRTFVPASERRISIYAWRNVRLDCAHRGWGIHKQSISNPASRSASMPAAAFCFRISQVTLTSYSVNVLAVFTRDLHRGTLRCKWAWRTSTTQSRQVHSPLALRICAISRLAATLSTSNGRTHQRSVLSH